MSWGPWITEGLPPVGAYVQVDCHHQVNEELRDVFEGIIGGYDENNIGWFTYEAPAPNADWIADRWRQRRPKGMELLDRIMENPVEARPVGNYTADA